MKAPLRGRPVNRRSLDYLVHPPLSLLGAVRALSLVGRHGALLLHARVAAVGKGPGGNGGPAGRSGSGRETLRAELHLRLAHEHTCGRGGRLASRRAAAL